MVIIYIPKYDWYKKMIEKKMRNNQEDAERMSFWSIGQSTECNQSINQSILFKDDIVL